MIRDGKVRSQLEDYEKLKKEVGQLQNLNKYLTEQNQKMKLEITDIKARYKENPMCQEKIDRQKEEITSLMKANETLSVKYKMHKMEKEEAQAALLDIKEKYAAVKAEYDNMTNSLTLIEKAIAQVKEQATGVRTTTPAEDYECEPKPKPWHCYLRELIEVYRRTGRLTGISTLAAKYHVRAITKEMFFQLGLSGMQEITSTDADNIADKIKNAKY